MPCWRSDNRAKLNKHDQKSKKITVQYFDPRESLFRGLVFPVLALNVGRKVHKTLAEKHWLAKRDIQVSVTYKSVYRGGLERYENFSEDFIPF